MKFLKENKMLIGSVLIAGLFLYVYFTYFRGGSSSELLTSSAGKASPVSQELLATLSNLNTIRLDNTIFSDPVFLSLTSFGVTIPPEPVGRPNPFAPLEGN